MTVKTALAALKRAGSKKQRDGYARYGIVAEKAFGVPMAAILQDREGIRPGSRAGRGALENGLV